MTKVQRGRILKLAAFLAGPVTRAEKRSGRHKLRMRKFANAVNIGLTKDMCHTSACALGWASMVFPRRFKLIDSHVEKDCGLDFDNQYMTASNNFSPAQSFFGLNSRQMMAAFGPNHRRTAIQEAAVLRKIAKEST